MTIFGYTWDEIKRAQQGDSLARRIPAGISKPLATEGDWELLERYGEEELRNRHYFGVLDRLENTRLANDMPDCDRSACPKPPLPRAPSDKEMLDWLQTRVEEGCVTMCFELDGGVHVTLEPCGGEQRAAREVETVRDGIAALMRSNTEHSAG